MKKLATIMMLVAALLCGTATLDAKTTKKKSGTKTTQTTAIKGSSLSVETFINKRKTEWSGWDYGYKDLSKIYSTLKNMGYTDLGQVSKGTYVFDSGRSYPTATIGFRKGSTEVYIETALNDEPKFADGSKWIYNISIKFGTSAEKTNFIKALKKEFGYLWYQQKSGRVFFGIMWDD